MLKMLPLLLLILGLNTYVALRFFRLMPGPLPLRLAPALVVAAGTACFLVSFPLRDSLAPALARPLYGAGTTWFFASIYFFLFFAAADLLFLALRFCGARRLPGPGLRLALMTALPLLVLLAGHLHYRDKQRREVRYDFGRTAAPGDTLTVVALSDLHLGYTIGAAELDRWIALVNREKPDLVVLVGDVIDCDVRPLLEDSLASRLRRLQSRCGVYAVPGNHEYIAGIGEASRFFREAGIRLLRDEAEVVDGRLLLIGRDDRSNRRRLPLERIPPAAEAGSLPTLLLDHQPYHLEEAARCGIDLQLSGHTHGGQVWPVSCIVRRLYEQAHGPLQKGRTHYYVTSGIGLWGGKFRIGTDSEYLVLRIPAGASADKKREDAQPSPSSR